jgi:hypothetical protein
VARDGKLLGADLDKVHAQLRDAARRGMPGRAGFLDAFRDLERNVTGFYREWAGCC